MYDFAQGGDTVENMAKKVSGPFQRLIETQGECNVHWKPANTLFGMPRVSSVNYNKKSNSLTIVVFWIGINDLA